ncbi:Uncharacterised protein [Cedecea lapagei]|uniref:Ead/Ea22-like family protein n=1 Tax=Cedecea lapagei TaxID=158823 RepID=A0A447V646_9ENTR|nr:hypothetical protein [Cedecea lapagei]VEC00269.1 Uncharacterised protein [Cedecea lapagei]
MTKQLEALIAEVKAAAEKATPGPYSIDHTGYSLNCSEGTFGDFLDMDNATFALEANPESILTLIAALEQSQRANAAQDDHINQQSDRIENLEKKNAELGSQLCRYSMSPGQADQRMCESRAVRAALGFGKDADNVAPVDLTARIDALKARIAELEASPLAVKLPKGILMQSAYSTGFDPSDWVLCIPRDSAVEAISAAGGTVDEGE